MIARRTCLIPVAKMLTRGFRVVVCVSVDHKTATTLRPRFGVCTDVTMLRIWIRIRVAQYAVLYEIRRIIRFQKHRIVFIVSYWATLPLAPRTRRERGATLECAGARLASEVFYGHLMTGFDTLCVRHEVRTSSHRQ